MKATKLNTSLALIGAVTVGVIILDVYAGIRGSKRRIFNGFRANLVESAEKPDRLEKKLNEISESITSLTGRLSSVEESMSKLDSKFEKRLVFPPKPEKSLPEFISSLNHSENLHEDHIQPTVATNEMQTPAERNEKSFSFDRYNDERAKEEAALEQQLNFINKVEATLGMMNIQHNPVEREYKRKMFPFLIPKRKERRRFSFPHRHSLREKVDGKKLNEKKADEKLQMKSFNLPEFLSMQQQENEVIENPAVAVPKATEMLKFASTPTKIIRMNPSKPVDFTEIFASITKEEDPLVEVTRFDNLSSFRKFGDDVREHKVVENNGGIDTKYYKMSDILSSDKRPENKLGEIKDVKINEISKEAINEISKEDLKKINRDEINKDETNEINKDSINDISKDDKIATYKVSDIGKENDKKILNEDEKKISKVDLEDKETRSAASKYKSESAEMNKLLYSLDISKEGFCEDFNDPEEAFKAGICLFKTKKQSDHSKASSTPLKISEIKKEAANLRSEKAKVDQPKLSSSEDKFVEENQIDKGIQSPFNAGRLFSESSPFRKEVDENDSLLEMIGTKLIKKDDSIQKPTLEVPEI
jgi:hypothetical protein